MPAELAPNARSVRRLRVDLRDPSDDPIARFRVPLLALLVGVFLLFDASGLDLGGDEARLGLAAGARLGPIGRVYGGWEPSIWPLAVLPSRAWAILQGGPPTTSAVRWPTAIAAAVAGLVVARRVGIESGPRASVLSAACLFGSLAMIDRSSTAGIDWISALCVASALDRLLSTGNGWVMGCLAALGFLAGGLPALAMAILPAIVIRTPGKIAGLLVPPALAIAGWSAWTLSIAPAQAWGAALTLPLTQGSSWTVGLGVLAMALPWTPVAALWSVRTVRDRTPKPARSLVAGWLQVGAVALIAGTVVPGMAGVARFPIAIALAVASAAVLDRAWDNSLSKGPRRAILGIAVGSALIWAALIIPAGCYVAAAIAHYRAIGVLLPILATLTLGGILGLARKGDGRGPVLGLLAVSLMLKGAHAGLYVPEWNYRFSQGPWGRAIGQWVPPKWTLYTTVAWPPDLAFAIGRPLKRLSGPERLADDLGKHPQLVLVHDSEFENWPTWAPRLLKIREFQDQYGGRRVLARTEGDFNLLRIGPGD